MNYKKYIVKQLSGEACEEIKEQSTKKNKKMRFIFENLIFTYPGALIIFCLGFYYLKKTIKEKQENYDYIRVSSIANGLVFSIGCIVFGLLLLVMKLKNTFN